MIVSRFVPVALLLIALTGCGTSTLAPNAPNAGASGGEPTGTASPTASPAPSASPTLQAAPDSANAGDFVVDGWYEQTDVFFVSPSTNLRCGIFSSFEGRLRWGCNAIERSWEFASAQQGDPCFQSEIPCGFGIEGWDNEVPTAMSHSDVSYASEELGEYDVKTLAYGESLTYAGVTCSSAEDGITCINTASGHGFTISKSRKEIF